MKENEALAPVDASLVRKATAGLTAGSLRSLVQAKQIEDTTFIVLDYSYSMTERASGGRRKIDALRQVAQELREEVSCPQVVFGGTMPEDVRFLQPDERIPEPEGGTPLTEAIRYCRHKGAKHLIVVSDGGPNDPHTAMAEAKRFGGPIDVFYVGPESDFAGRDFMQRLASATKGSVQVTSLNNIRQITAGIRGLLTGGKP